MRKMAGSKRIFVLRHAYDGEFDLAEQFMIIKWALAGANFQGAELGYDFISEGRLCTCTQHDVPKIYCRISFKHQLSELTGKKTGPEIIAKIEKDQAKKDSAKRIAHDLDCIRFHKIFLIGRGCNRRRFYKTKEHWWDKL